MALIRSSADLEAMRASGRMLATVLAMLKRNVSEGITTLELDKLAETETIKLGGEPAFKGYHGFPNVLCTSVNEAVVHGIPDQYELREGDIIGLDYGVKYKGMITDSAISVIVGKAQSKQVQRLVTATQQALDIGIDTVKDGIHVGDIGAAIENRLRSDKLGVVEALVGHGVGYELHESPEIPNIGVAGQGPILKKNMTVAIEPMATLGGKDVRVEKDGWTVTSADGSLSAHFEHTILVTDKGAEILTQL